VEPLPANEIEGWTPLDSQIWAMDALEMGEHTIDFIGWRLAVAKYLEESYNETTER
jgi:hypothetical protein